MCIWFPCFFFFFAFFSSFLPYLKLDSSHNFPPFFAVHKYKSVSESHTLYFGKWWHRRRPSTTIRKSLLIVFFFFSDIFFFLVFSIHCAFKVSALLFAQCFLFLAYSVASTSVFQKRIKLIYLRFLRKFSLGCVRNVCAWMCKWKCWFLPLLKVIWWFSIY